MKIALSTAPFWTATRPTIAIRAPKEHLTLIRNMTESTGWPSDIVRLCYNFSVAAWHTRGQHEYRQTALHPANPSLI